ncbi:MAG: hypothetical protein ACXV5H_04155 [Halobacteriota archaeon]
MASSDKTYRNLLLVIAILVAIGIVGMAIGMFTLLNDNDVSVTGHHEITPVCTGACYLVW